MAGSYRHVTRGDGSFRGCELIENLGDAAEAIEEMWYMIDSLTKRNPWSIYLAYLEYLHRATGREIDAPTIEDFTEFWDRA